MLDLIYRGNTLLYTYGGYTEQIEHREYLIPFQDRPIPAPQDGKNKIVVCALNVGDGIGDYMHLVRYCKWIKAEVGEHYEVCPVLVANINISPSSQYQYEKKARQEFVIRAFHQFCAKEGLKGTVFSNEIESEQLQKFIDLTDNAAAAFEISANTGLCQYAYEKHNLYYMTCGELGGGMLAGSEAIFNMCSDGGMGLKKHGIDFDDYHEPLNEQANTLLDFQSENGKTLVNFLLESELSQEKAIDFLQSHKIMPGYPQTQWAAQNFVLTGILKNMEGSTLQSHCDFILPKNCVALEELQYYLQALDLDVNLEIITPNDTVTVKQSSLADSKKVRIYSGFFVTDDEYQHLHRIRTDLGLGSGDSTNMQVLSSEQLPSFHLNSTSAGTIYDLLDLIDSIQGIGAYRPDDSGFLKLKQYLEQQKQFKNDFDMLNSDIATPRIDAERICFIKLRAEKDKYKKYLVKQAQLSKDPDVLRTWGIARTYIQKNLNYNDKFKSVLAAALHLNNPNPSSSIEGEERPMGLAQMLPVGWKLYEIEAELMSVLSFKERQFAYSPVGKRLFERQIFQAPEQLADFIRVIGGFLVESTLISSVEAIFKHEEKLNQYYQIDEFRTILLLSCLKLTNIYNLPNPGTPPSYKFNSKGIERLLNEAPHILQHIVPHLFESMDNRELCKSLLDWAYGSKESNANRFMVSEVILSPRIQSIHSMILAYLHDIIQSLADEASVPQDFANSVSQAIQSELASRNADLYFIPEIECFYQSCQAQNITLAKKYRPQLENLGPYPTEMKDDFIRILHGAPLELHEVCWPFLEALGLEQSHIKKLVSNEISQSTDSKVCSFYCQKLKGKFPVDTLIDLNERNLSKNEIQYLKDCHFKFSQQQILSLIAGVSLWDRDSCLEDTLQDPELLPNLDANFIDDFKKRLKGQYDQQNMQQQVYENLLLLIDNKSRLQEDSRQESQSSVASKQRKSVLSKYDSQTDTPINKTISEKNLPGQSPKGLRKNRR